MATPRTLTPTKTLTPMMTPVWSLVEGGGGEGEGRGGEGEGGGGEGEGGGGEGEGGEGGGEGGEGGGEGGGGGAGQVETEPSMPVRVVAQEQT